MQLLQKIVGLCKEFKNHLVAGYLVHFDEVPVKLSDQELSGLFIPRHSKLVTHHTTAGQRHESDPLLRVRRGRGRGHAYAEARRATLRAVCC